MSVTFSDMFCGAGGSSIGAVRQRGYTAGDAAFGLTVAPDPRRGGMTLPVAIIGGRWIACGPGLSSAEIREEGG